MSECVFFTFFWIACCRMHIQCRVCTGNTLGDYVAKKEVTFLRGQANSREVCFLGLYEPTGLGTPPSSPILPKHPPPRAWDVWMLWHQHTSQAPAGPPPQYSYTSSPQPYGTVPPAHSPPPHHQHQYQQHHQHQYPPPPHLSTGLPHQPGPNGNPGNPTGSGSRNHPDGWVGFPSHHPRPFFHTCAEVQVKFLT